MRQKVAKQIRKLSREWWDQYIHKAWELSLWERIRLAWTIIRKRGKA